MPELSNEYPSREELQSYLNEHWQNTTKAIDYFRDSVGIDCDELFAKLYDSLLKSLYRLNDFPRENKFWLNTNEKPTIYKLSEFCWLILAEDSNDRLALWTLLANYTVQGARNLNFPKVIKKLIELGEMNTDFLVKIFVARHLSLGGDENFASLIIELGKEDESKPLLEDLIKNRNKFVSYWAQTALSKIENQ